MLFQYFFQNSRRIVERKPDVPDGSPLHFPPEEFETAKLFALFIGSCTEIVDKIIIEIFHSAAFQLFGKNILEILCFFEIVGRHLVRQAETFPRIPFYDSLPACILGTPGMIRPPGLKVRVTRFHEFVDEPVQKFLVD